MPSDTFAAGIEAAIHTRFPNADIQTVLALSGDITRALTHTASEATAIGAGEEDMTEIQRIMGWIDQAIERAKRHGNTEGIWLLGSQWRTVRSILAAASPKVASDTAPLEGYALLYQPPCGAWYVHSHKLYGTPGFARKAAAKFLHPGTPIAIVPIPVAALAASPTASDTDTAIPGGWKLVPIEPTVHMIEAWRASQSRPSGTHPSAYGWARDTWAYILAASPKPDTDTPVDPGVEGVLELGKALCLERDGPRGRYGECKDCRNARYRYNPEINDDEEIDLPEGCLGKGYERLARVAMQHLAAKPIAGTDAGEVKARQCPHGEPLNTCADCKREHQEATA